MQLIVLALAIVSTCFAFCNWNLNNESLREKCFKQVPEWMEKQIEADFASFLKEKITASSIEETLQNVINAQGGEAASLVRVYLKDGNLDVYIPIALKKNSQERMKNFLSALNDLNKIVPLPNLDFLISFSEHYDRPLFLRETKVPIFTMCKAKSNQRSILLPNALLNPGRETTLKKVKQASAMYSWEEKEPIAFWRGSLSEGFYPYFDWDFKPRPLLVFHSRHNPNFVDAKFTVNSYFDAMNHLWKKWMKENDFTAPFTPPEEQIAYRYLIAIDSTASPASLQWQLFSGSTLLKAESAQQEWFYRDLVPYVHYLPFRTDSADLSEKVKWLQEHPIEARSMAEQAQYFAEERLLDEAVFHFTYCVFEAYAKLVKD